MASWEEFELAEPEFSGRVRSLFDGGRHKTIATLRADGTPRISGIEREIGDGQLRFGSMSGARKGADLWRDPHFAIHGPTVDPTDGDEAAWPGEAKVTGRAERVVPTGPPEADSQDHADAFVADITEVVITRLDPAATRLVVESWTPRRGLQVIERD